MSRQAKHSPALPWVSHVLAFVLPSNRGIETAFEIGCCYGTGVNLSSKPENIELYKLKNLALQIDELARYFQGDDPFNLVGHDWGGALAWAFAQHYPQRLNKLVDQRASGKSTSPTACQ